MGRSDDMLISRAVNIHPGQIDHVFSGIRGIESGFQIFLERKEDGKGYLTLKVKRATSPDADKDLVERTKGGIKKQILVSAHFELVE